MEKHFLLYVLYISIVEIREKSYKKGDNQTFGLCNLLHNIPLMLGSESDAEKAYTKLIDDVEFLGIHSWLENRKKEFYSRYPEYDPTEH
ncbi:hypothetical protein Q4E93_10090 [Flavitalea sp. BT771]|uniref:hypothetical protein n=1 Tax=Flavitalea sp. BT771 TaxID=3063329 RepID=UPI0026E221EA|nr:hypothetical protein [Flavitalea sp. BT771]MDO6430938.1 hypothetical protein [Flavitalea sp. BT771]MDV6219845.1 hypothetical protein [Flavitalea sp. BT771]